VSVSAGAPTPDAKAGGAAPDRGRLAERPLADLLLDLYRGRFTGELTLQRGSIEKRLRFERGAPVSLTSTVERDSLLALLERRELITAADRETLATRGGADPLVAVLRGGKVPARELLSAVRAQVRAGLSDCFGWAEGDFALAPADPGPSGLAALRSDPWTLVRDGLRAQWSADRLLADLAPRADRFASPRGEFEEAFARLGAGADADELFEILRRREPLASALGRAAGRPAWLAILWVLDRSGLLEYADERPGEADEAGDDPFAGELEIEVADATPGVAPKAPTGAAPADPAAAPAARSPEADELAREIERLHGSRAEMDHYELLGIAHEAESGAIRKAYFRAAKRFHPDALAGQGLAELRDKAGEVFARIAEAHGVLSDPQRRMEYDAVLRGDSPQLDTAQLAQAEAFFRKGEILVKMGDFRGAMDFLEPAVELWPGECAYQSALGWALHKKSPPENERALEHLGRALELDPEDGESHFRLGTLLRAMGDERRAAEHLALAKGRG